MAWVRAMAANSAAAEKRAGESRQDLGREKLQRHQQWRAAVSIERKEGSGRHAPVDGCNLPAMSECWNGSALLRGSDFTRSGMKDRGCALMLRLRGVVMNSRVQRSGVGKRKTPRDCTKQCHRNYAMRQGRAAMLDTLGIHPVAQNQSLRVVVKTDSVRCPRGGSVGKLSVLPIRARPRPRFSPFVFDDDDEDDSPTDNVRTLALPSLSTLDQTGNPKRPRHQAQKIAIFPEELAKRTKGRQLASPPSHSCPGDFGIV
jgi:hypothetical protein